VRYSSEIAVRFSDEALMLRREVRMARQLGVADDEVRNVIRSNMAAFAAALLKLPLPCGEPYLGPASIRHLCDREAGHTGRHEGDL